jgi:hypothetical protein
MRGIYPGSVSGLRRPRPRLIDLDQHLELVAHRWRAAAHLHQTANLAVLLAQKPADDRLLTRLHQQLEHASFNAQGDTRQTTLLAPLTVEVPKLSST